MNRTARILAVILAIVIVGIGIYAAYESGFERGALTTAAAERAEDGSSTVVVTGRGWGHRPWGYGGFGFFPFFWIFPLLFLFLIFGAFRRRGPWNRDWGSRHQYIEDRFRDMHDKAHGRNEPPSQPAS